MVIILGMLGCLGVFINLKIIPNSRFILWLEWWSIGDLLTPSLDVNLPFTPSTAGPSTTDVTPRA
jgi:hypothetical protein